MNRPARAGRVLSFCRSCLERIVAQGRHHDVIAGRGRTGHAVEGRALDILVLHSGGHSAVIAFIEVLPETDGQMVHLLGHRGAVGSTARERSRSRDQATGIDQSWNAEADETRGGVEYVLV